MNALAPKFDLDEFRERTRAVVEIGPRPQFLEVLIRQHEVLARSAARRNDPEPVGSMVTFETLRDQLAEMQRRLPLQRERWAKIEADAARARLEKIFACNDPAERKAEVAATNDSFRDRPPAPWQDDMSGVADPNAIGVGQE